ncbi:MAG: hypothetical protein VX075_16340, partial [Pseudomonadota bacterium]|nr:hypothetical protein [Pseudomonadota bacterium]
LCDIACEGQGCGYDAYVVWTNEECISPPPFAPPPPTPPSCPPSPPAASPPPPPTFNLAGVGPAALEKKTSPYYCDLANWVCGRDASNATSAFGPGGGGSLNGSAVAAAGEQAEAEAKAEAEEREAEAEAAA